MFSDRYGHTTPRNALQIDSMDDGLRNRLWNLLKLRVFDPYQSQGGLLTTSTFFDRLAIDIWSSHIKNPLDSLQVLRTASYRQFRDYYFGSEWYEIFNLIEFIVRFYPAGSVKDQLIDEINSILQEELSDCRIIDEYFTKIIDEQQVQSVERALVSTSSEDLHVIHFQTALRLLSDRTEPDYRNSIKESISAVEQVCHRVARTNTAGVSDALNVIERKHSLHGAFKSSLLSLYGFTSDGAGIRHPLKDEGIPTLEDALFMLVSCSAFVNYLLALST